MDEELETVYLPDGSHIHTIDPMRRINHVMIEEDKYKLLIKAFLDIVYGEWPPSYRLRETLGIFSTDSDMQEILDQLEDGKLGISKEDFEDLKKSVML